MDPLVVHSRIDKEIDKKGKTKNGVNLRVERDNSHIMNVFWIRCAFTKEFHTQPKSFEQTPKRKNKITLEVLLIGGMVVVVNVNCVFCIHFVHYYA